MSHAEQDKRVEEMLEKLGIKKCADTMIGNVLIKGISGGEKKRVAIAVELITHPKILFLDEPTSGLDSYAAYNVVQTLKDLALNDKTAILCTIHQPSSEVFDLFSRSILLSDGHVMFNGECKDINQHFATVHNAVCPANYNIADFVMFHFQKEDSAKLVLERDKAGDSRPGTSSTTQAAIADFDVSTNRPGFCYQLCILAQREGRQVWRDKGSLIARFSMAIFLNLIYACIFKDAGSGDVQTHFGGLVNIIISMMFGSAQPIILVFPLERPIFIREYATGTYGAIPYALSKLLIEIPLAFLNTLVVFLVSYWMMGLQGNFILLVLCAMGMSLVASSTALVLGSLANNVQVAMQITPVIFVPQLLFAGFFIRVSLIPEWLRWAQYMCSMKFALNLAMLVEFADDESQETARFLASQSVSYDEWWIYLLVLVGLFLAFRIISVVALKAKAGSFS
jgi:energy-coupling factor transporter ATP-binding protein EcfA2/ABC-type multidrug transport system permease subunit